MKTGSRGQGSRPAAWPKIAAVRCGHNRMFALGDDGSLWAWGSNRHGELGLGYCDDRRVPSRVGDVGEWREVASGLIHAIALKRDGSLWAWGGNEDGQLGRWGIGERLSPQRVGEDTDWVSVAAGARHSVALKRDGSLWAWGGNLLAQLGLGDHTQRLVPTLVGGNVVWSAVSAGWHHTVALTRSGFIKAWGANRHGQLGVGDHTERLLPASVGVSSDWRAIGAGGRHTLALKGDGSLWSWGAGDLGQLGHGDRAERLTPQRVGSAEDWAAVSAGMGHCLGLRRDGSLWAWGANGDDELGLSLDLDLGLSLELSVDILLGLGPGSHVCTPTRVDASSAWTAVSAGANSSGGLKADGGLWAWGLNEDGQLGLGDYESRSVPRRVQPGAASAAVGTRSGSPRRPPDHDWRDRPTQVLGDDWAAIAAGDGYSLAVKGDGSLWAWGYNSRGQLGLGGPSDRRRPTRVAGDGDWAVVAAGFLPACAVRRDGSLWSPGCTGFGWWDVDSEDELREAASGLGVDLTEVLLSTFERASPDDAGDWATVVLGAMHTVGLKRDGSLWSWGANERGQLGIGDRGYHGRPTRVGEKSDWALVAAGRDHSIALKRDCSLWAWGRNDTGQLGIGDHEERETPTGLGEDSAWMAVAAGDGHTLALKLDGTLWAWGGNESGQLGIRRRGHRIRPTRCDEARDWASVAARRSRSFAIKLDGTLWAWGDNSWGQLGLGDVKSSFSPRPVGGRDWASMAVGLDHTLALKRDGTLWAWGVNSHGQLGVCDSAVGERSTRVQSVTRPTAGTNRTAPSDRPAGLGLLHPVAGRLPLGSVPNVVPYRVAEIEIAESVPNLASMPASRLAEWLVEVVDIEGPIHVHEAARRIAHAVGVKRVGSQIDAAFRTAALMASYSRSLVQCGDFLWRPDCTDMIVRDRSASPLWVRKTELLADEEIEWAICSVLSSLGWVDEDDLPRRAMKAMGFARTRRDADQRVRDARVPRIEAGAFVRLGPGVVLVGADCKPAPPLARPSAAEATPLSPAAPSPPARPGGGMPIGTQRILKAINDAKAQGRAALLVCLPPNRPTPWLVAAAEACVAAGADLLEFQARSPRNPAEVVAVVGAVVREVAAPCLLWTDFPSCATSPSRRPAVAARASLRRGRGSPALRRPWTPGTPKRSPTPSVRTSPASPSCLRAWRRKSSRESAITALPSPMPSASARAHPPIPASSKTSPASSSACAARAERPSLSAPVWRLLPRLRWRRPSRMASRWRRPCSRRWIERPRAGRTRLPRWRRSCVI